MGITWYHMMVLLPADHPLTLAELQSQLDRKFAKYSIRHDGITSVIQVASECSFNVFWQNNRMY
jgi:hypothetical protein